MGKNRPPIKMSYIIKKGLVAFCPDLVVLVIYQILIRSGVYSVYPWLDNPLHIFGAAGIAWASLVFLREAQKRRHASKMPFWLTVIFVVGIAAIVGIVWEQYEFLWDLWNGGWLTSNVADFIKDLTNDLLGAFVFSFFATKKMLKTAIKRAR
jgi:hypothetical protein